MANQSEIVHKRKSGWWGRAKHKQKARIEIKLNSARQLQVFPSVVLTFCRLPTTTMANQSEIVPKRKSGWWGRAKHKQKARIEINSNSARQLQVFHSVVLTHCTLPTTTMANQSEIVHKRKSGEKEPNINKTFVSRSIQTGHVNCRSFTVSYLCTVRYQQQRWRISPR